MVDLTVRNKSAEILSNANNPELEMDFRATCLMIQLDTSLYDPPLMQTCQDYLNACQHGASLYSIRGDSKRTYLYIYNTETETQKVLNLQTPQPLDWFTCITQLPNGKLFCFGNCSHSGYTVLIDKNGEVEVLPSGTPCSCIYLKSSVYLFGGYSNKGLFTLSSRFDLGRNRWIQLTPIPQPDYECHSLMFNRNILISGRYSRNLLLYSVDIDSFSAIPYEFGERKRKILINLERSYLIECDEGGIYESEIGSYINWRQIGKAAIYCIARQVYCSYNKEFIHIGIEGSDYFKFDLNERKLIALKKYKMLFKSK
ncbi:unnamed protein product [Blepharisma stoltei]|uniref:Uncharacterized protein n=1 Tax=Blepharisma stoltei TaxID=1481888 RepID=A0AAU9K1I8_9CILI|nr:unnamed protein product [Blepharisma stoltei]